MMFIECESFDFDFEITLFDRDFWTYANDVQVWKIVLVEEGFTQVDPQYGRKGIQIRKMRILELRQIREQAEDKGLINQKKRIKEIPHLGNNTSDIHKIDVITPRGFSSETDWDGEFEGEENDENMVEAEYGQQDMGGHIHLLEEESPSNDTMLTEYTIFVPPTTSKQTLLDLKEFLLEQKVGEVKVFIDFKGQKIDTKTNIDSLFLLEEWLKLNSLLF